MQITEKLLLKYLKQHLKSARFKHTLGTAEIVLELAKLNGVNLEKARIAALLHDAGKRFNAKDMVQYALKHRLKVPCMKDVIKYNPSLLHSYISADIAKKHFSVKDKGILSAIALHTVGAADMGMLAKIVYVADSVSFDRRYPGVKELRALAYRDINAAARAAMANKLFYVLKKGAWLHPEAVKAWNFTVKI